MAITIAPRETNWGESAGRGLGAGLGEGLQMLAQQKMQEYAQRQNIMKTASALEQMNVPKETAMAVASLPPEMQNIWYKEQVQAPRNQAFAQAINQTLGGQPQGGLEQMLSGQPTGTPADQQAGIPASQQPGQINIPAGLNERQTEFLTNVSQKQQKLAMEQSKQRKEEDWRWDKKFDAMYDEDQKAGRAAEEENQTLDSIIELAKSGTLPAGHKVKFIESLAKTPIIGAFINPDELIGVPAQVMKTTAKALMKNASKITGGQVRVTEWNTLLSMIPSLMNTTEGQIAISDTRKIFNNMVAARAQIERDVKDENGGLKPKNFDTLVEKRYKPIQTEMSQQLTNRIKQATWIAGTEMDHLPDPKTVPAGKGIIDDKGRRLKVVNGEWKEIK